MYQHLVVAAVCACVAATVSSPKPVVQIIINEHEDTVSHSAPPTPDGLNLIPLHPNARTGLVDPVIEEGLIAAAGPRFANEFLANITEDGELGSCWGKCAITVLKETPCVYIAVSTLNPGALLNCNVTETDLCKCADCLPDVLAKYVDGFCNETTPSPSPTSSISYTDFAEVAQNDLNIQAYRGDLKAYHLDAVNRTNGLGCTFGSDCNGCCCTGLCIGNRCIGGCF